jgi:hypothetical protein
MCYCGEACLLSCPSRVIYLGLKGATKLLDFYYQKQYVCMWSIARLKTKSMQVRRKCAPNDIPVLLTATPLALKMCQDRQWSMSHVKQLESTTKGRSIVAKQNQCNMVRPVRIWQWHGIFFGIRGSIPRKLGRRRVKNTKWLVFGMYLDPIKSREHKHIVARTTRKRLVIVFPSFR